MRQANNEADPDDPVSAPAGEVTGDPEISYGVPPINVQSMANFLKKSADFSYSVRTPPTPQVPRRALGMAGGRPIPLPPRPHAVAAILYIMIPAVPVYT